MDVWSIDWTSAWREVSAAADKGVAGSEESKRAWDKKAASFAHKPQRSDYINQLIGKLALRPGESVLDAGAGPGTLAVPLARAGHDVAALDLSPMMLHELVQAAQKAGVVDRIQVFERSWQQGWEGIPVADVAVSSRSLITLDLADAVAKLEGHARRRVVVTTGAGDLPYRDHRILAALGRADEAAMLPTQLSIVLNYLFSLGRLPRVDYIEFAGTWQRDTREELVEAIRTSHKPEGADQQAALEAYLDAHIVANEDACAFELDYARIDRWAYIEWDVPPTDESPS